MDELIVDILSERVGNVPVKVECQYCGTVNHWQRWHMQPLPGTPDVAAAVCWSCDERQEPPRVRDAVFSSLEAVLELDVERQNATAKRAAA